MSPVYDKGPGGGYWYYLVPIAVMVAIVLVWLATGAHVPSGTVA
jgi:hypothetical protein